MKRKKKKNILGNRGADNTNELRTMMKDQTDWKKRIEAVGRPDKHVKIVKAVTNSDKLKP